MTRSSLFISSDGSTRKHNIDKEKPTNFISRDVDQPDRSHFGKVVVWGYLALVGLVSILPLIIWATLSGDGSEFDKGLPNVQNLIIAMFAGLSGVAGLAGLVVGRYFGDKSSFRDRLPRKDKHN